MNSKTLERDAATLRVDPFTTDQLDFLDVHVLADIQAVERERDEAIDKTYDLDGLVFDTRTERDEAYDQLADVRDVLRLCLGEPMTAEKIDALRDLAEQVDDFLPAIWGTECMA